MNELVCSPAWTYIVVPVGSAVFILIFVAVLAWGERGLSRER